ncbi:hypothetical protein BDA96_02G298100 [Sorghum bicolor]|jgi:hypothetical protein|uniref:Uncharacterized protein n=2 Tax=Sorghum bicolor TaxID=4558 RepID=A0A921UUP5_SORBI|nr:hypothetical protein BDA96_02G298100 [Sorghum bicolor]KAG0544693.1 hypothetical protein BDA96_02G298100 [Sorghum bicolor]KXG36099.1 hypothetical protein SORBI_3002G283100 [Sorghum bicolor]
MKELIHAIPLDVIGRPSSDYPTRDQRAAIKKGITMRMEGLLYHEVEEEKLYAVHCVNTALQGPFSKFDISPRSPLTSTSGSAW